MRRLSLAVLLTVGGSIISACSDPAAPTRDGVPAPDGPLMAKKIKPVTIDGIISHAEWTGGDFLKFKVNAPEGIVDAILYVKNDATNLYLAVEIDRATGGNDGHATFEFNNDNDAAALEFGDDVLSYGGLLDPPFPSTKSGSIGDLFRTAGLICGGAVTCVSSDNNGGGTIDGTAALRDDGSTTIYEMSHPLNSGDVGHDFALGASGSTIGFFAQIDIEATADVVLPTYVPAFGAYCTFTTGAVHISCPSGLLSFVRVEPLISVVAVGATQQLTAAGYSYNGNAASTGPCAWSSSNLAVASVDPATGLVTGNSAGAAIILATCTPAPGATASWQALVNVVP